MNQTIYFRKEIWELFKDEPNKSEVINRLLDMHYSMGGKLRDKPLYPQDTIAYKNDPEPIKEPFVPRPPDPETGYPCCLKAQPCKHWTFDGTSGLWTNSLTGKSREVV